jgi:membrane-bound metal-dependent hydrolase YbcI (DUF457 family)
MKSPRELRRFAIAGLAAVAATDAVARTRVWPRAVAGVLDETAHLGTGLVVLAALAPSSPRFEAGLLAGSVLIDVDHIPDMLGSRVLRAQQMRPVPHSVATLLALASRPPLDGVLVGVTAHLARDLATGTNGVPLLWPFSRRSFAVPYGAYAAGLAVLAALAVAQSRTRLGASSPRVAPRKSTATGALAST